MTRATGRTDSEIHSFSHWAMHWLTWWYITRLLILDRFGDRRLPAIKVESYKTSQPRHHWTRPSSQQLSTDHHSQASVGKVLNYTGSHGITSCLSMMSGCSRVGQCWCFLRWFKSPIRERHGLLRLLTAERLQFDASLEMSLGHDSSVGEWLYLTVCPHHGPGHDSSVGEWLYLTVCPIHGPGPGRSIV